MKPPCPAIVAQLQALIPTACDDARLSAEGWTDLVAHFGISSRQVLRLFELTEEACSVAFEPVDAIEWLLSCPTLLGLAEMVEQKRAEAAQGPIGGAA